MRIIGGYQNTKLNGEDFVLTPYLFWVWSYGVIIKVAGLGIGWGHHAAYIGIGFGIPKEYPSFKTLKSTKNGID